MAPAINPPNEVLNLCSVLHAAGWQAWLVGGAVRDAMLGREPHDWDIATDASPEIVLEVFPRCVPTGLKHGTVTVVGEEGSYEVTTFRGEGAYSDGRHPDAVQFLNSIDEDLARRDFTVNAIAFDPISMEFSDPFGGQEDLRNGIIRAVGNPLARFQEDGLRVLRAARFCATLGFTLDPETAAAIRPSLESYAQVSVERVRDEWVKAMAAPRPSVAFRIMLEHGMLEISAPELLAMVGCTQNRFHEYDVWNHTMEVLDGVPPGDPILRIAALLHDVGKPASKGVSPRTGDATFYNHEDIGAGMTHELLSRLRFSNADRDRAAHLVLHHFIMYERGWAMSAVRRWVRRVGPENVESLLTLARADYAGKGAARESLDPVNLTDLAERIRGMSIPVPTSTTELAINGRDVMEHLNLTPGPRVGQILRALLDSVTDDPDLNDRDTLLRMASELVV